MSRDQIHTLFRYLKDHSGSDLHLVAGQPARIRRKGKLQPIEGQPVLINDSIRALMRPIAEDAAWETFESTHDLDFAYALEGVGRFRANYFRQEHGLGAVYRLIPDEIIPIEKLNLPEAVEKLAHLRSGLVLVTGPTGSGKSTTLASVIDRINSHYVRHVVTIEDPVEFVHQPKKSVLSHREVGRDSASFGDAMRAALRQDPDVVVLGEMRDVETISLALSAAQRGILVFGTLHTNSAAKTIDRLVDAFPADEQPLARMTLADSLRAVVAQVLVPTADGKGRCAVNEILISNRGVANLIRQGNTAQLFSAIQAGKAQGMQAMDDALFALVQKGTIAAAEAYLKAQDKARFEK